MNWTPEQEETITKTIEFIRSAHKGQKYGTQEYWTHPVAVANTIDNPTFDEYLAALLHDVIEDTQYTATDLRTMFSNEVVVMVELLTSSPTNTYRENIEKIINSNNRGAMKVKLADNLVNFGGDKSNMKPERRERLTKKYTMSINMLKDALGE